MKELTKKNYDFRKKPTVSSILEVLYSHYYTRDWAIISEKLSSYYSYCIFNNDALYFQSFQSTFSKNVYNETIHYNKITSNKFKFELPKLFPDLTFIHNRYMGLLYSCPIKIEDFIKAMNPRKNKINNLMKKYSDTDTDDLPF